LLRNIPEFKELLFLMTQQLVKSCNDERNIFSLFAEAPAKADYIIKASSRPKEGSPEDMHFAE